jgi:hypothetical protein
VPLVQPEGLRVSVVLTVAEPLSLAQALLEALSPRLAVRALEMVAAGESVVEAQ